MKSSLRKNYFILFIFFVCAQGMALNEAISKTIPKFTSAHSVLLDGFIENGLMVSSSDDPSLLVQEINEQLMYSIGQLNGINGGSPDMAKTKIVLGAVESAGQDLFKVHYSAKLKIAWPIEQNYPKTYELLLPAQGDYGFLSDFFAAYGKDEDYGKKCLAPETHDVELGNFWYYYRPLKRSCSLRYPNNKIAKTEVALKYSAENTEGKFPEYGKVWEDGKLVVTLIFGMADAEENSPYDAGIMALQDTVQKAFLTFGMPKWSNVQNLTQNFRPGKKDDILHFKFDTEKGELDMVLLLVEDIKMVYVGSQIEKMYNARTQDSDFVSYSGHSGLGANIRKLARMGSFKKDQYQIFLINGCDTFAYVDEALARAHQIINPEAGLYKHFDLLTNAMPSYFHMNARSNMAIVTSLLEAKKTYQEILAQFDPNQRAAVTGEEDNVWPAQF